MGRLLMTFVRLFVAWQDRRNSPPPVLSGEQADLLTGGAWSEFCSAEEEEDQAEAEFLAGLTDEQLDTQARLWRSHPDRMLAIKEESEALLARANQPWREALFEQLSALTLAPDPADQVVLDWLVEVAGWMFDASDEQVMAWWVAAQQRLDAPPATPALPAPVSSALARRDDARKVVRF